MFLSQRRIKNIIIRALLGTAFIMGMVLYGTETHADELDLKISGEAQIKLDPNTAVILGQEHKLHLKNIELHKSHTNLGAYWRLTNWFTGGVVYRTAFANDGEGWALEHRPYADVSVHADLFGVDLSWRPRVEYKIKEGHARFRIRKKLKVEFKTIPTKPFVADEVFVPLEGPIERNRIFLGLSPIEGLTTFYMLEMDFGELTEYKNIVGLDYKLVF